MTGLIRKSKIMSIERWKTKPMEVVDDVVVVCTSEAQTDAPIPHAVAVVGQRGVDPVCVGRSQYRNGTYLYPEHYRYRTLMYSTTLRFRAVACGRMDSLQSPHALLQ